MCLNQEAYSQILTQGVSTTGEPLLLASVSLSLSDVPTPLLNEGPSAGDEEAPRDDDDDDDDAQVPSGRSDEEEEAAVGEEAAGRVFCVRRVEVPACELGGGASHSEEGGFEFAF